MPPGRVANTTHAPAARARPSGVPALALLHAELRHFNRRERLVREGATVGAPQVTPIRKGRSAAAVATHHHWRRVLEARGTSIGATVFWEERCLAGGRQRSVTIFRILHYPGGSR